MIGKEQVNALCLYVSVCCRRIIVADILVSSAWRCRFLASVHRLLCCVQQAEITAELIFLFLFFIPSEFYCVMRVSKRVLHVKISTKFLQNFQNFQIYWSVLVTFGEWPLPRADHILAQNLKGRSSSSAAPIETIQPVKERQNTRLSFSCRINRHPVAFKKLFTRTDESNRNVRCPVRFML